VLKIRAIILLTLILFLNGFSDDAKEILAKSSSYINSLQNFSLDFKVKTVYDVTDEERFYEGTLTVGQKDRFALRHSEIEFISDGVTIWEHRTKHKQVLVKSLIDLESGFHPSEILFKYLRCTPTQMTSKKEGGSSYYVLTLDPTNQITYLKSMEVWLKSDNYTPYRLKTIDVSDNTSWYTILSFNPNPKLNDQSFVFTPDTNIEIIDMR
jgi:outer membrane lipoprotein-sorting protein